MLALGCIILFCHAAYQLTAFEIIDFDNSRIAKMFLLSMVWFYFKVNKTLHVAAACCFFHCIGARQHQEIILLFYNVQERNTHA